MAGVDIHVLGRSDRELVKRLEKLGDKVFRKVARPATSKAMTPVLQAARLKAPVRFGVLKKSLGKKTKTYTRKGVVVTVVGPRRGFRTTKFGDPVDPSKYAHLVEFGHAIRRGRRLAKGGHRQRTARSANPRGGFGKRGRVESNRRVAAKAFLAPAFQEKKQEVIGSYSRELAAGVVREAMKKA